MICVRQLASGITGDMQINGRRSTIQTEMQMRPTEPRQKHRSTKERKKQLSGSGTHHGRKYD